MTNIRDIRDKKITVPSHQVELDNIIMHIALNFKTPQIIELFDALLEDHSSEDLEVEFTIIDSLLRKNDLKKCDWLEEDKDNYDPEEFFYLKDLV